MAALSTVLRASWSREKKGNDINHPEQFGTALPGRLFNVRCQQKKYYKRKYISVTVVKSHALQV